MDCLTWIVKNILYIVNVVFAIIGVLIIAFGSVMIDNIKDLQSLENLKVMVLDTETIPAVIIVVGCVVFIISFFGCYGAIKENTCFLLIYATLMFILFVMQMALIVWSFMKSAEFMNTVDKILQETWKKNNQADGYPMDAIQMSFKCCGLNSYNDYTAGTVPKTCCGSLIDACTAGVYEKRPGCQVAFHDFWISNINIIRYAGMIVALVELVAVIFACSVASSIRNSRRSSF